MKVGRAMSVCTISYKTVKGQELSGSHRIPAARLGNSGELHTSPANIQAVVEDYRHSADTASWQDVGGAAVFRSIQIRRVFEAV